MYEVCLASGYFRMKKNFFITDRKLVVYSQLKSGMSALYSCSSKM